MELGAALKRVGATIVKEKILDGVTGGVGVATFYLRVDPDQGDKWVEVISALLISGAERAFTLDVSKYFYVAQGAVKYLWRIIITGDTSAGMLLFGSCALTVSVEHAPEITSFPLVGRAKYPFDPAKGKIKGSYEADSAVGIINLAVAGGVTERPA